MRAKLIRAGGVIVSAVALAAACSEDDGGDDGSAATGASGGAGGEVGEGAEGGETAQTTDACETIEGLDVAAECDSTAVAAELNTVNMLLVMDKSTSMEDSFVGGAGGTATGESRWETLNVALGDALTSTQEDVNYGLLLYPAGDDCNVNGVQVPVTHGTATVSEIATALDENAPDVSGTPMAAALEAALEYYTTGSGSHLDGDKYVLLATDGGPNCNSDLPCGVDECTLNLENNCPVEPDNCCADEFGESAAVSCVDHEAVTTVIRALLDVGVETFVVGIPGSEAYAGWLTEFAAAGDPAGERDYYQVTGNEGAAGLTDTFESIALDLIKDCAIPVGEVPNVKEVNVAVDCTVVPGSSWEFSEDQTVINIVGEECDRIRIEGVERLDVILGCPVIE